MRIRTHLRRAVVTTLGIALFSTTVAAVAAPAATPDLRPPTQKDVSIPGGPVPVRPMPKSETDQNLVTSLPAATWPGNGSAEVVFTGVSQNRSMPAASNGVEHRRAGTLPVAIGLVPPDQQARSAPAAENKVKVETFDQKAAEKAGINGVLLKVTDTAGATVSVQVDYTGFANAYGGDYGTRLRLLQFPGCVLTTPDRPECRLSTAVRTDNHTKDRTVTAQVALHSSAADGRAQRAAAEGTVLAAAAAPSGIGGSYQATSLSPSGSWSGGSSSGDFGYSLPVRLPPAIGGATPEVSFGYSSGSLDGRTSATNNQASWVGDGWDLSPGGYIERRFKGCSDDKDKGNNQGKEDTGDNCWVDDNATIVLGGASGELVKDAANNRWRPKKDDGSYVELLKGATNGDNDGEHWKVTTTDGTQYFLGLNRLPGWDQADPRKREETKSAWTMPVYGNHAGEPCHVVGNYPASFCQQAWRWNLDYAVDRLGNVTTYYYDTEVNHYGRNNTPSAPTQYVRAGNLKRIEYGLRKDNSHADEPMRVRFETEERCLPSGAITCAPDQLTKDNAKHWPDVPFEQLCDGKKDCTELLSPTFFSRKRLTKVVTELRKDAGSADYRAVDSWTLRHTFPDAGDGLAPAMWLAGVTHTGHVNGTKANPEVKFGGTSKPNRVNSPEGTPALTRYRLTSITGETGGHTEIKYSGADCVHGSRMPANAETNGYRCYPVYWGPRGAIKPVLDYFHKYVVTAITDDDRTGGSQKVETTYEYEKDAAAWHFDSNDFGKMEHRTWSDWRGYGRVREIKGAPGSTQSVSDTFYLRGMDEDRMPNNGKRDVHVKDSEGRSVEDHELLRGQLLESIQYDNGKAVSGTTNLPEVKGPTATNGDKKSYFVQAKTVRERTLLSDGTWRRSERTTGYDPKHGIAEQVDDSGDLAVSGDERCTRTTYARNEGTWVLGLASRVHTVALPCAAGTGKPEDLVSDIRTHYDGAGFGTAANKGLVTATERWDGSKYQNLTASTFDDYGRPKETRDAKGQLSTHSYSPAAGMAVTEHTVTNPLKHETKKFLEPAWGAPVAEIGSNGERTDLEYDPLGRLTKVWSPNRPKAVNGDLPDVEYVYELRTDAPTVVTSRVLTDSGRYVESYKLYDGLLRERQQQRPGSEGGRVLTDIFYDSRGFGFKSNAAYYNVDGISKSLHGVVDNTIHGQTVTEYDGLGRSTASIYREKAVERWRSTTRYEGDRTHVTPPAGGVPTTEITDARGQVVERRQYHGGQSLGTYDAMTYGYTRAGELEWVKDAAGNTWSYKYDHLGRKYEDNDPDRGKTTYGYNEYDQLTSTTDARGRTLSYGYDTVGRKVALYEDRADGRVLHAKWDYDTLKKGLLTSSTRYIGGQPYTTRVAEYDTMLRPKVTVVSIPAQEGKLARNYVYGAEYTPVMGLPKATTMPEAGGLASERIVTEYDDYGLPTLTAGKETYAQEHRYTAIGESRSVTIGEGSKLAFRTTNYELGTRRVETSLLSRNTKPGSQMVNRDYTYDPAGNITKIADVPEGGQADVQCFRYDHLRRLRDAFTPKSSDCATDPAQHSDLGGAAPYWSTYGYDVTGNRTEEVQHTAQGAVTRRFEHPTPGSARPHAVTAVTRSGPGGEARDEFTYDETGNTKTRRIAGSTQTLEWNAEGRLTSSTGADGKVSRYEYDADGTRLLKRENGTTTLYLPGMELMLPEGGEVTAKRYYSHGGSAVAVRGSVSNLSLILNDHQGTANVTLNATTLDVTKRYQDPFGIPRGPAPGSWPDDKGFVGGTRDATGLTHIGAREYDPSLGRFISVDPIMDLSDPQQMHGYTYANGSPITFSDPTGLKLTGDTGGTWGVMPTKNGDVPWGAVPKETRKAYPQYYLPDGTSRAKGSGFRGGSIPQPPAPKPRKPIGFWGQVGGFFEGVYEVVEGTAKGLYAFTTAALDCQSGGMLSRMGATGAVGGTSCGQLLQGVAAIIQNPGQVIDEMVKPFKEAWNNGEYGKLAGLAVGTIAEVLLGSKGIGNGLKSAKHGMEMVENAAKRADPPCNSFVPGTLVLLADGSSKPIEELALGDLVLATDPVAGRTEPREVTATIVGSGMKSLVEITVDTDGDQGGSVAMVTATGGHPFWVVNRVGWRDAHELRIGDQVRTDRGELLSIVRVDHRVAVQQVRNLTVDSLHTYYVLVGKAPVLVHNSKCFGDEWSGAKNLDEHFNKHGDEMGFDTVAEYKYAAQDLMCLCDGRRPGVLMKKDGEVHRFFDPGSGEFGATGPRGIITYFKPENGMDYFRRQPGVEVP
ncbi:RHS repeat-associated protein [Crossiella equi]|uniref:RHS repeat-associated protein n=1 Tax=Crossiella equi TaxID=130796 RepID=A0ABS5APV8_9PSEU|nr:RHS repeat-associated core domain-containing protein [Crossiella equi]MBP2478603.1 RHS repeat-associated protein [Crossiella equi]